MQLGLACWPSRQREVGNSSYTYEVDLASFVDVLGEEGDMITDDLQALGLSY